MVNRQGNSSRGDGELEDSVSPYFEENPGTFTSIPRCAPAFARLEVDKWDCQHLPHFHEDKDSEEEDEEEGEDDGQSGGESEAGQSSIPDATRNIMVAMEVSKKLAERIRHARTLVARIAGRKYKVTLAVCPSQAIPVWKAECQTFFPSMLTLRVFYGTPQTGPHAGRSMVLRSTAIGLLEYLEQSTIPHDQTFRQNNVPE